MKSIKMVDLNGQYEAIKGELDIAINSVMSTTSFINGPAVKEFQNNLQEYLTFLSFEKILKHDDHEPLNDLTFYLKAVIYQMI